MAGDYQRHRVCAAGAAHGSHGLGRTDRGREVLVGAGFAARDLPQGRPHALLEDGAADVERQFCQRRVTGQEGEYLALFCFQRLAVLPQVRLAEFGGKRFYQCFGGVPDLHRTQAAPGRGEQDAAERGVECGVGDGLPLALRAVGFGGHAEACGGLFIEARERTVTRLEHGVGHAATAGQRALRVLEPQCLLVVAWRKSHHALEAALQVEGAGPDGPAEFLEGGALPAASVEVGAGPVDQRLCGIHGRQSSETVRPNPSASCASPVCF